MIQNILLFEPKNRDDYYPFSILHPIWEMRIGALKLFERFKLEFPNSNLLYFGNSAQTQSFLKRNNEIRKNFIKGNLLAINSSVFPNNYFFTQINKTIAENINNSFIFTFDNEPCGIYLTEKDASKSDEFTRKELLADLNVNLFSKFPKIEFSQIKKLNYLFDAIYLNRESLIEDAKYFSDYNKIQSNSFFSILNPDNVFVGQDVTIMPNAVLDATDGPIIIDDEVTIMPQATILGPTYIGKNTIIKIGAKIYHNNSFGEWCKIGGEVEESIVQGYSNKQHEGFLGHSFLGEWVNLGADTNTSDLKNTYSNIKIRIENKEIDTKKTFLGLLCGDHTKSGINTMFTTGSVVGICGILVREWFLPNFIPSFSWGGGKNSPIYKVDKAIETARIVMKRRNKELTPEEEKLMKMEYERVLSLR